MITPVNVKPKQVGGSGGLWGKIAGGLAGLVGGVATVATGGAAAPAIPAMMGAGSAIGGAIGGAVDPGKMVGGKGISPLERASTYEPEVAMQRLDEAKLEIANSPDLFSPNEAMETIAKLDEAKKVRMNLLKAGGRNGTESDYS